MTVFVALAFVCGFAALIPQIVRVFTGGHEGVSTATWLLIAVANISWATFFILRGDPLVALGNTVLSVSSLAVAAKASTGALKALSFFFVATAAVVAVHFLQPQIAAALTAIICAVMFAPQTYLSVVAFTGRKSLEGVALSTWAINVAVAALWVVGGVQLGSLEVVLANAFLAACSTIIAVTTWVCRHRPALVVA
jgi:hypothetical protein